MKMQNKLVSVVVVFGLCVGLASLQHVIFPQIQPNVGNEAKLLQVSHSNDDFDARLLASLEADNVGKNVFISAFSISSVLTMLLTGGVNETYNEIYNALGFSKSHFTNQDILTGYQQLIGHLNHPTKESVNTLNIANAVAIQKNKPILESFINNITTYFGAQLFSEDFVLSNKKAVAELNSWVSEKTHAKIPKLFEELPPETIMVLMNAMYFKGVWDLKFKKEATKNEPFHVTRDQAASVPFMSKTSKLNYAEFNDGQLVEIPYKGLDLSMYIYLPRQDTSSRQISSFLGAQTLQQRIEARQERDVVLSLPKFKFEGSYTLKSTLTKLGMRASFDMGADFSHINGQRDLHVSEVVHKTYIDVNEEGSEAAAATGVVIVTDSVHIPQPPVIFRADRPFAFFIRDNQRQLTLFSGIVNKPEYKE